MDRLRRLIEVLQSKRQPPNSKGRDQCPGLFLLEFLAFIRLPILGDECLVDQGALE